MFEELDYQETPLGPLVLRRRRSPAHRHAWVYEVTIDGEFLMSSAVKDSELALASLPLQRWSGDGDRELRILVGGLGLGYTALAALENPGVRSVLVVELLEPVMRWHRDGMVPASKQLTTDPRVELVHADFFELMKGPGDEPDELDAILLDIDHSPEALLHARHATFYEAGALQRLAGRLVPDGVFALWSADAPSESFLASLARVFGEVETRSVRFDVPHMHCEDENFIVLASARKD